MTVGQMRVPDWVCEPKVRCGSDEDERVALHDRDDLASLADQGGRELQNVTG